MVVFFCCHDTNNFHVVVMAILYDSLKPGFRKFLVQNKVTLNLHFVESFETLSA